jgi:hypothetical protein
MKSKPSTYHIALAPTSRARCRRCKCQVHKGSVRIVTTAFVKHGHTVRFTRCVPCIDAKLAAAILNVYSDPTRIPSTVDVDADAAKEIHATIARFSERTTLTSALCHETAPPSLKPKLVI